MSDSIGVIVRVCQNESCAHFYITVSINFGPGALAYLLNYFSVSFMIIIALLALLRMSFFYIILAGGEGYWGTLADPSWPKTFCSQTNVAHPISLLARAVR